VTAPARGGPHDDPYPRCGLRGNPFAHDDPDGSPGWAAALVDVGLPGPAAPGGRQLVQVIGVRGAGKTTTLRRWHEAHAGPWRHVPPGPRRARRLPVAPLVYWDEADRAPAAVRWWAWRATARRGATVVAGTHADLGAEARAAGLAVRTVRLPEVTAEHLLRWAALRFAATATEPGWCLPEPVAVAVAARCGNSWRSAGDLLHAWVAGEVAARAR
jgi:hypothetical protein